MTYQLDELAGEAGVAPRTVRYYVQRGLLPAPEFRGKDTSYGREHLARLRAIKVLQQAHLPLERSRRASRARASTRSSASPRGRRRAIRRRAAPPGGGRRVEPARRRPARRALERVEIADGVELHVRTDAPERSRRIALDIESRYTTLAPKGSR